MDLHYIITELQKAISAFEERQRAWNAVEKAMFSLIWDTEELKHLDKEGIHLCTNLSEALDFICAQGISRRENNIPRKLASIRTRLCDFIKGVFHFKRTPTTHMFVLMLSSESRSKNHMLFLFSVCRMLERKRHASYGNYSCEGDGDDSCW